MRFAIFVAMLLITSAFSSQPLDERKAQELLPVSKDNLWKTLSECKVHLDVKNYLYSIDRTSQVKAMEGKPFTVRGFMMPLEPAEKFKHFLLSKRTPTCPFCPPGEPNEIIEVFSQKPMAWQDGLITMAGTMAFTDNPELGLFFQMKDAVRK
jgi:hypothetical protein